MTTEIMQYVVSLAVLCLTTCPLLTSGWCSSTPRSRATFLPATTNDQNDDDARQRQQIRLDDGEMIDIISRNVELADDWCITIWEQFEPSEVVEHYWNMQGRSVNVLDPFGIVLWPGATVAAQELAKYRHEILDSTVLLLGAGTGVEAQAVAQLGAAKVIATDYNPVTLKLLEHGVQQAGLDQIITAQHFDMTSMDPLPDCDIMIAADVMYSDRLSNVVGDRCCEALRRRTKVLVTDSQRFADFVPRLRKQIKDESIVWQDRQVESFTGSGVMVDVDQTYDVVARVLLLGWGEPSSP